MNSDDKILKIFTLNCWGLRYVSEHRQQRIKSIAQHLAEHDYNIVFLQEVWCQSDYDYIRTTTQSKYKFGHMFKNASILGTSGLVVLTTWTPKVFHFHPFSVNGSPFRPFHGDWFTSKGVGYVRIDLDGLKLHLFCTHMHAQYDLNERIHDQYSIHRICQSYETAKFIELMTSYGSGASEARDLIVLAGDMNASSKELPYRLLVSLTGLNDCYKFKSRVTAVMGAGDCLSKDQTLFNDLHDDSDDDLITCGHRDNAYTPRHINPKNNGAKRIDFILFKLIDKVKNKKVDEYRAFGEYYASNDSFDCIENSLCKVEHIRFCAKDESGLSFSDHQPVVAKLNICTFSSVTTIISDNSISELNCAEPTNVLHERNAINVIEGESVSVITGNKRVNFEKTCELYGDGHNKENKLHEISRIGSNGDGINKNELCFNEDSDKFEEIGLLTGKRKLMSNILLEVTETASKVSKTGPLQLRQIASNAIKSKMDPKIADKNNLLEQTKCLLDNYVMENQLTLSYCLCLSGTAIVSICLLIYALLMLITMTIIEMIFLVLIITMSICLAAFLKFLSHLHEKNAVKAILNDIKMGTLSVNE